MIFLQSDRSPSIEPRFYKGGRGGSSAQVAATPVPRAIPPVTRQLSDFSSVERDQKKKDAKRRGFGSTILAGSSGAGFGNQLQSNFGQKTLLGS